MNHRSFSIVLLLAAGSCYAQVPTTTAPPTTAPVADASVDAILDRLRDVGVSLKTLRATVSMNTTNLANGRDSTLSGTVLIERRADGDTRGHVDFTKSQSGNRITLDRSEYLLDGDWVVDRVYRKPGAPASVPNRETHRQIREPGTKTDLLKLGAGPFPLPIGQSKEAVREQFDVALAPASDDHAGLTGVTLTPRAGTSLAAQFHSIVVWLAPGESMPGVIETLNKDESDKKTTTLAEVKLNAPVTDADFTLTPIQNPDEWKVETLPYRAP